MRVLGFGPSTREPPQTTMNKFLISILAVIGLTLGLSAQPAPVVNPCSVTQMVYIDSTGHSVPFAIVAPSSGLTTVVFDPITSLLDQSHAFNHEQKIWATSGTNSQPLQLVVLPGIVNTDIGSQETRVVVPFSMTANTTLTTIPFSEATNLQINGHYRFRANLYVITGSGGTKIDVGGTCNTSNFIANYRCYAATTLLYGGQLTSFLSGPSGSSTGTATEIVIEGELDVTNGGTFVIQFAQNGSNATASTVLAGSTLTITQIP